MCKDCTFYKNGWCEILFVQQQETHECDDFDPIEEDEEEHIVQECICLKCYYRWVSVRPVGVLLKDLECPCCHNIWYVIGTGEPIDERT